MKKVFVYGDVMVDHWLYGTSTRTTREHGNPTKIIDVNETQTSLGGAANVMSHLGHLGLRVSCFGLTGLDKESELLSDLALEVPNCEFFRFPEVDRITTVKTRLVDTATDSYFRFDKETRQSPITSVEAQLMNEMTVPLNWCDLVVVSDYNKGAVTRRIFEYIVDFKKPVIVDPKFADGKTLTKYSGATLIKLNQAELPAEFQIDNAISESKCLSFVVTMGSQGLRFIQATDHWPNPKYVGQQFAAIDTKVVDTIGCGDAAMAGLVYGYLHSETLTSFELLRECCVYANAAGALAASHRGTNFTLTREALERIASEENR